MDKLQEAIRIGLEKVARERELAAEKEASERHRKAALRSREVERHKTNLGKDDYLYKQVTQAVSKGETEIRFEGMDEFFAEAVRSFPGFRARREFEQDPNSEDPSSMDSVVTITWDSR